MVTDTLTDMQALASLYRKKAAVIAALNGGLSKDGRNDFHKYDYVRASDVKQAVGLALSQHGLALHISAVDSRRDTVSDKGDFRVEVQYQISLCDTETGAAEMSLWYGESIGKGADDKGFNKASTSALKYFLLATFLIGDKDEDEHDADKDGHLKAPSSAPQKQPQKAAPTSSKTVTPPAPATPVQAPTQAVPVPAPSLVILSSDDETRWPAFLKWALDKFNISEPGVMGILAPVMVNGVFKADRTVAMAHLLANAAGYVASEIRNLGNELKLPDEVIAEAHLIPTPEVPF